MREQSVQGLQGKAAAGRPRLTLYSRAYCHLCHDMEALVRQVQADLASDSASGGAFDLDVVDVDSDPALEARFNELVPVLMQGERELARYHLDAAALRREVLGNRAEVRPEIL